jgi:hypothetical protein
MEEDEIEINYEELYNFDNYEVMEAKFNIMTAVQTKIFDKEKYIPEEKFTVKNEKGEDETKEIPLGQFIRWRYEDDPSDEICELDEILGIKKLNDRKMKSNSKIVEWSDGTHQLIIGDEYYDIMFSAMDNVRFGVHDKNKNSVIVNKPIKQRLILTPSEFSTHVKKVEKVIDKSESSQKTKLAYNFYDKQEYRKEDFTSVFGKKKNQNVKKKTEQLINRKRKKSNLSN